MSVIAGLYNFENFENNGYLDNILFIAMLLLTIIIPFIFIYWISNGRTLLGSEQISTKNTQLSIYESVRANDFEFLKFAIHFGGNVFNARSERSESNVIHAVTLYHQNTAMLEFLHRKLGHKSIQQLINTKMAKGTVLCQFLFFCVCFFYLFYFFAFYLVLFLLFYFVCENLNIK